MEQKTLQEIRELAEKMWEGCHGCDENDKAFWINGFVHGYLEALGTDDTTTSPNTKTKNK